MRKSDDKLKESLNKIIVPAFSTAFNEADDDKKQKMNKVIFLYKKYYYYNLGYLHICI